MSLVMAFVTSDYILISGDKRATFYKDTGEKVIKEDFQKIKKKNRNIILGFTGDVESFLKIQDFIEISSFTNDKLINTVSKQIFEISKQIYIKNKNDFNIMLGGINNDNRMEVNYFSTLEGFNLKTYIANKDDCVKFIDFCSDTSNGKPMEIFLSIFNKSLLDTKQAKLMLLYITQQIAKIDDSVNKKVDFLYLDKNKCEYSNNEELIKS
ncbi:hypothetical protein [Clostridioides sp. ZZV14-6153]|uniref:hypothetical protein n=1 Tax=Clostridioides sp. ZZV14-6153 TaxID=2811494 RepID=UPI001D10A47D|nr:hypothetical protein [Clostridioides sp. ZZV14-6153]